MIKLIKNNLKVFVAIILTAIICISVTAYAAIRIQADEIGYKDGTVEDALNDLYTQINSLVTDENVELLANNTGGTYTFTKDYDYVIVTWLTDSWTNTNYYVNGITNKLFSYSGGNLWGLRMYGYSSVKIGNSIVLDGAASKAMIIVGINK